ncbi:MAG: 16S rRNA (uracil(1498)-N(3))-methyltransferase [Alphaproteobacteria bacterium]|nr:16S rRNA (uracil(1498)-N(3))-methyltransferase [Alphaproteobacteria bacterium]
MIEPRLFVDADLSADAMIALERAQAHYLTGVLRRKVGDGAILFNGRDGAWRAVLVTLGKSRTELRVEQQIAAQTASPDLWLLFAPLKHGRIDFLVEKATELGVSRLVPVLTAHTQSERVNVERLRARAIEAAEQTERFDVPEIAVPVALGCALDRWPAERILLVCDEAGGVPIADALAALRAEGVGAGRVALLVGPEGGLAEADRQVLALQPARRTIALGPRILRAETAALAALALIQAMIGDGASPPRPFLGQALTRRD